MRVKLAAKLVVPFLPTLSLFSLSSALHYPCLISGPDVPVPTSLSTSPAIQSALANFTSALNSFIATGNSSAGAFAANETSFSIGVFSAYDESSSPFWQYHNTAPNVANSTVGVKKVDENSVYWMASITKLFSDYALLVEAGDGYWNQPVTKYVPELAAAAQGDASEGVQDVEKFRWEDVTVGQLGGQLSGTPRDYMTDISTESSPAGDPVQGGFPPLNASQVPTCTGQHLCDRKEFFDYYLQQRKPVYLPGTTPTYSNDAFQLLGYAIEGITNKTVEQILKDRIFGPLNMTHSSFPHPPNTSLGVIPSPFVPSSWELQVADAAPSSKLYSSLHDITLAGRSILSSTLLTPAQTRRWLKPHAFTASPFEAIGIPWQIHRTYVSTSDPTVAPTRTPPPDSADSYRLVDLYTKDGLDGAYNTYLLLIPDYDVGIAILTAGKAPVGAIYFGDLIVQLLLPALEAAGREEATAAFTGTFASDAASGINSSMTLSTADGLPGLQVTSLVSNGSDLLALYAQLEGQGAPVAVRAYPSNLVSSSPSGSASAPGSGSGSGPCSSANGTNGTAPTAPATMKRMVWNLLFMRDAPSQDAGIFAECDGWEQVSVLNYGSKEVDQVVFEMDQSGKAKAVEWPGMRITLERKE